MVGGGYAGVMAANRVTQRDDVTVTVINPRQVFVPRLRLHQLVGGTHDAVVDYREVLAEGVELVVGTAVRIDATARTVTHTTGESGAARRAAGEVVGRGDGDRATLAATEMFVAHRNLLFTVAYELLGSGTDADDVLQETWLRWVGVDAARVDDPRVYLVRITTRQSLNRLRSVKRRREAYVGAWLPEPLLTTPDMAADLELAESVSMGLMVVLETLTPTERAVFVLREAFGLGYDEIAAAVEKSAAAVYQIAPPRPPPRRSPPTAPRGHHRQTTRRRALHPLH